ncbi:MAG TPA: response regulator [Patescibacteria group bacterium]|nr:response regulator [Patescibacteria group bacterium]
MDQMEIAIMPTSDVQKYLPFLMKSSEPREETPPRVLIVDDDQDFAFVLSAMVEMLGYKASIAYSGPMAIDMARRMHPHVVLLDIGMPGMDGYEVCQVLKNEISARSSLIIAHTGWDHAQHRLMADKAGFDMHLPKPANIQTLKDLFDSLPRDKTSAA